MCCFGVWTGWQQSFLTCDQVCEHRTRDLSTGLSALGYDGCNYHHSSCPRFETQYTSCKEIDCRKLDFKKVPTY